MMLPVWLRPARGGPGARALKVHALRSAVVAAMALLFFWGLVRMPMAEAIALSFIAPLIALYLAAVLLARKIQPKAIVASLLGLAGVAVIAAARLGSDGRCGATGLGHCRRARLGGALCLEPRAPAPAGAAREPAGNRAVPEPVRRPDPEPGRAVAAAVARSPQRWRYRPGRRAGGSALLLLSWGYARAEAQVLLPIEYTGFIWAALFGWLMFAEAVTWATLAGVALIVVGSWIAARKPTQTDRALTS